MDTTSLDFRGHRLCLRTAGQGPVLWLVHGFPTSGEDWAPLFPALAARRRVVALDMLGFGRSDKPADFHYSIAASADQWEALAEATGVRELQVVAHDYGNTVVQELLARQLDGRLGFRITGAVFLNGGLFPEASFPLPIQRLLAGPLGPLLVRFVDERRFAASLDRISGRPWPEAMRQEAWRLLQREGGRQVMPKLLAYIAERRRFRERWVGALQLANIPIGLVAGLEDPISGRGIVARWRELLPGRPVVELPGIGHYPQVEDPATTLAALESLLD